MAEKGRTWTERETKLLLQIWSKDRIQRQLQGVVRNNAVYQTIADELARHGFQRTLVQCRQKLLSHLLHYQHQPAKLAQTRVMTELALFIIFTFHAAFPINFHSALSLLLNFMLLNSQLMIVNVIA